MRSKVDRRRFLGFINLESRPLQLYAAIIVIGGFWLFFGMAVPIAFAYLPALQGAANFGDMFGAASSLFSGLALAGIAYTLFQQQKQIEISQKAARIESFTFLAELHYRLMNDAPDDRQTPFKKSARYCMKRAIEILGTLEDDESSVLSDAIGTAFYSQSDYALASLSHIYSAFAQATRGDNAEQPNSMGARHATHLMLQDMEHWIERYKHCVNTENIKNILRGFDLMIGDIQYKPSESHVNFTALQREWMNFWMQFSFATFAFRQNIHELLVSRKPPFGMDDFEKWFS